MPIIPNTRNALSKALASKTHSKSTPEMYSGSPVIVIQHWPYYTDRTAPHSFIMAYGLHDFVYLRFSIRVRAIDVALCEHHLQANGDQEKKNW